MKRSGFLWLGIAMMAACSPKPILYPNAHYQQVGEAAAEQDIEECKNTAKDAGAKPSQGKTGQLADGTATGGAVDSAVGAVGGAVVDHPGRGAMVGAAGGATAGFLRSLFRKSSPRDAYKQFVQRFLTERGYEPMGWE